MLTYNDQIYSYLDNLAISNAQSGDMGRYYGYKRAIDSIKSSNINIVGISSLTKLESVKFVGPSIIEKIKSILTGQIILDDNIIFNVNPHKHYVPRDIAVIISNPILSKLKNKRYEICGSFRRGKLLVGDLDILICDYLPDVDNLDGVSVLAKGSSKIKVKVVHPIYGTLEVDLRSVSAKNWGSALLYFTGPSEFNIRMRSRAKSIGYKLNEYCLEDLNSNKKYNYKTERSIFRKLGMEYVPPESR